jgi:NAD(P)-dependent dehydrogenase (short-subunit alcohol dehydrogenase family)
MRLADKVAVVTGATKGIGEGIARRFALEGARTVIVGRDRERGSAVEADIRALDGEATFIRADLTSEADVQTMTERVVELYGGIDVLVNNAYPSDAVGAGLDGPIATQTAENFERQIQVDVYGVFRTCRHVIPEMQRRSGGSIINISALVAVRGAPGQATYSVGKGAIHGLTWSIAADYGCDWIRANVVIVGFVPSSDYTKWLDAHPVAGPQLRAMGTLSRTGTPDDVANACVYLASDESSFVTGATLNVDGGIGIKLNPPDLSTLLREEYRP